MKNVDAMSDSVNGKMENDEPPKAVTDDPKKRDHLFYADEERLREKIRAIGVDRYDFEEGVEDEFTVLNGTALEFGMAQIDWGDGDRLKDKVYLGLSLMNREHAVVHMAGGEVRYVQCTRGSNGERELRFLKQDDLLKRYAAIRFKFEGRSHTLATAWLSSTTRRQFEGVGFYPGSKVHKPKVPDGYLNLFRGYAVQPKQGDWSRFRYHLLNCVCGGNEVLLTWLLDWFAQMLQAPQFKMGTAVVLISAEKGTGKSMVAGFLMRILGPHGISVSKSDHVTGRFNSHLEGAILAVLEEAFFAGDKAAASSFKDLVTADRIAIERKGMDVHSAPNYTRVLITSNEARAVPVSIDERRIYALHVANPRANDPDYFGPIYEQMYEKGGLAGFLHDMLERKITSNLRKPPETGALVDQREESLDGVERAILRIAREGMVNSARESLSEVLSTSKRTEVRTSLVRSAIREECNQYEERSADKRGGALLRKLGVERTQPLRGNRRHWVYNFPPLNKFRANIEAVMHVKIDTDGPETGLTETTSVSDDQTTTQGNVIELANLSRSLAKQRKELLDELMASGVCD